MNEVQLIDLVYRGLRVLLNGLMCHDHKWHHSLFRTIVIVLKDTGDRNSIAAKM
jgi:hypothetical protein